MVLAPETLTRHELIGLEAEVVDSTDPGRVGQAGQIVAETHATLELAAEGRRVTVPKPEVTLRVRVPDGRPIDPPAPGDDPEASPVGEEVMALVEVDGSRLVGLPQRAASTNGGTRP